MTRGSQFLGKNVVLLLGLGTVAAFVACGDSSKTNSTGGPPPAPQVYEPKGCRFQIAPRAEYTDFAVGKTEVSSPSNIRRVRLGLGGNVAVGADGRADPATSAGFAWQTDDGTFASEVAWGKTPDPASWSAENRANGMTWLTPQGLINPGGDQRMHEAHVCGLDPGTTYYYRVGGGPAGKEEWSDVYSFTTTPKDPNTQVTIGIAGDSRGQENEAWRLIQRKMMTAGVDVQLFSGDMTNLALDQGEWDKWLDLAWKDADDSLLSLGQILTLSTHGNHENHSALFYGNMVLPQDKTYPKYSELFYSVDVGPVHIVVVDDAWVGYPEGDPEYAPALTAWLEADLDAANKNRANVPWIVTMHHHHEFSSSNHGQDADVIRVRQYFVPILDKYHVDVAIAGHDHNYERSKPVTGPLAAGTNEPVIKASPAEGTVYVVCAGAGAESYSSGTSSFTEFSKDYKDGTLAGFYGFLTATKTTLEFKAHELHVDGSDPIADEFTITK